jgi:hypothetical protein
MMEMETMFDRLLAKKDADRKTDKEEMMANQAKTEAVIKRCWP